MATRPLLQDVPTEIYSAVDAAVTRIEKALTNSVEFHTKRHFTAKEWQLWLSIKTQAEQA